MKVRKLDLGLFAKSIPILLVLGLSTQSATAGPISSKINVPAVVLSPSTLFAQPQLEVLLAKAQAQGSVRVIVGLDASYRPEGRLPNPQAIQAQRRVIEQMQDTLMNQMANRNIKAIKKFAIIPYLVVEVDADALAGLAFTPNVASIAEDRLQSPSLMVSVPLIGAPIAWASGYTGAGETVAILDTGIDKTHPFLSGRVVSEACYSSNYPPDTATSLCPGGVSQSTDPGSGIDCTVVNICWHGTHVAGIAAGRDDGSIGFSGVAKDANIISIQVYSYFSNCNCIQAYDSDILSGLERVQTLKSIYDIAAVNLSLGGDAYTSQSDCDNANLAYRDMFANLRSLGIAAVIASGNNDPINSIEAPGCVSGAISVGSTQDGELGSTVDAVSSFSDSASFLTLLAPGQYIYSSIPGGGFQYAMGTSMAAPHVAGAWAVLKSAKPLATVDETRAALYVTGKPVTDPRNGISKPRIQVNAAVNFLIDAKFYYFPLISK